MYYVYGLLCCFETLIFEKKKSMKNFCQECRRDLLKLVFFSSTAVHKALDCFLLSRYLSLELFNFFFVTSSCNFFVSVQGDEAYV